MIFEINSNNNSLSYNKNKFNNNLIGSIHVKKNNFSANSKFFDN